MPVPAIPRVAKFVRIAPNWGLVHTEGSSGSPPGGVYDKFCPATTPSFPHNSDPTNGYWFDSDVPSEAGLVIYEYDETTPAGMIVPDDGRVVWDSPYVNYFGAYAPFFPDGTCAPADGFGIYPTTDIYYGQNDLAPTYPDPQDRDQLLPGSEPPGIFYCAQSWIYGTPLVGGGGLAQFPVLLYRTLDPSEPAGPGVVDPLDHWWSCYYCPTRYVFDDPTGDCLPDTDCDPGTSYCIQSGTCIDSTAQPDCFDERGCGWSENECDYVCQDPSTLCPAGQTWNMLTCACEDVPVPPETPTAPCVYELRAKILANLNVVYWANGNRESRTRWPGQSPKQETVLLPKLAYTALSPPLGAVAVALDLRGLADLRLKGAAGDTGVKLTADPNLLWLPVVIPLGETPTIGIYNAHSAAQSVPVRWLLGPRSEDAPD